MTRLLVRTTGAKLLSDQKIQQLVVEKATAASQMQQAKIACLKARLMPAVRRGVDLYAAKAREVVLIEDGIQVKQQKAKRERREAAGWQPSGEASSSSSKQKRNKRVTTDVAMLEKRELGSYEHLCGGIDEQGEVLYDVVEAVRAAVVEHYGNAEAPLAVMAITDGAQHIRSHLEGFFGGPIPVILDWYHLCKRVKELISMTARCKTEREQHLEPLFPHLWRGRTEQVLAYLRTEATARHPDKL